MSTPENAIAINGAKYFSVKNAQGEWVGDPLKKQAIYSRTFVPDTLEVTQYDTVDEVVSDIVDNGKFDIPALPDVGELVTGDKLYSWNGMVVRCRQTHNRTIYDPTDTLALFTVYRKETGETLPWIVGEQVDKETLRTYDGVTYECIQPHVTQEDWTPTAVLNVLWKVYEEPGEEYSVWKQPTGAHDAYQIGDIVWFPTEGSTLYRSKINANVWSPTVYPAGWEVYTP